MLRKTITVGVVAFVASVALAQTTDVARILRDTEAGEFRFDDQTYHMQIRLQEEGTVTREIELEVLAKGKNKLLIRIMAPGEVAGMTILQLDRTTTYIYNPEDRSVRLIAASAQAQGFLGTDWGAAETSLVGISNGYNATLLETTDEFYRVQLDRTTAETPYSKIIFKYDRAHGKASEIEYYLDGVLAKTLIRDQWQTQHGIEEATRFRLVNAQTDRVTEAILTDWRVNEGLEDRLFTKRSLMLGE